MLRKNPAPIFHPAPSEPPIQSSLYRAKLVPAPSNKRYGGIVKSLGVYWYLATPVDAVWINPLLPINVAVDDLPVKTAGVSIEDVGNAPASKPARQM
jgi:hypothetical protein